MSVLVYAALAASKVETGDAVTVSLKSNLELLGQLKSFDADGVILGRPKVVRVMPNPQDPQRPVVGLGDLCVTTPVDELFVPIADIFFINRPIDSFEAHYLKSVSNIEIVTAGSVGAQGSKLAFPR